MTQNSALSSALALSQVRLFVSASCRCYLSTAGLPRLPILDQSCGAMEMGDGSHVDAFHKLRPWNEGRLIGAKRALKQQQVWAIRFWLDQHRRLRDRALFDFAIDSKLRGCDVVRTRIGDVVSGGRVRDRAIIVQQKTKHPLQFELMDAARKTMRA